MTVEVYEFAVTIPAGTAKSAGFTSQLAMPVRSVDLIEVRVPPGPRGEVGFGIGASGTIVLPQGGVTYFVMDDQFRSFTLENAITSGAWVFFGYNTGQFPHTIYATFHVSLPYTQQATVLVGTPIPASTITEGGGAGTGAGTGAGSGTGGGTTAPPVVTPPVVTPPGSTGTPVILPPSVPGLPGEAAPALDPSVDELLIGAGTSGGVWLLDERGYSQVAGQDDLDALLAAGVVGVQVSDAQHAALLAAASTQITVQLGDEILTGSLLLAPGARVTTSTAGRGTS